MAGKKGRSGRPQGLRDISSVVRAQFLKAIEIHKKRTGKSFAEVLADMLERDPWASLNTVAKFKMREVVPPVLYNPPNTGPVPPLTVAFVSVRSPSFPHGKNLEGRRTCSSPDRAVVTCN